MRRTRQAFVPVVSPSAARRRARPWAVLGAAVILSPFAVLALADAGWLPAELAILLAAVAAPAVALLLGEMFEEKPPIQPSGLLLTARTLTGERTIDLFAISTVRLLTYFSRSGVAYRVLLVRDINGVRLGVRSTVGRAALLRGLKRNGTARQPRMSRAARVYLGLATSRTALVLHTVLSWLAMVFGLCCYMSAVLSLADHLAK